MPPKKTKPTPAKPTRRERRVYTEEELEQAADAYWTPERTAAYEAAQDDDDAMPELTKDLDAMRPQTERLVVALIKTYAADYKGVALGVWPPFDPGLPVTDTIVLGRGWVVQVSYDPNDPTLLVAVEATSAKIADDVSLEILCDEYEDEGFDSFVKTFPLTPKDRTRLFGYLKRNYGRAPEAVEGEDEDGDDQPEPDTIVPLRRPS
ncbi:hypothetical protein A0U89_15025 (plasmid) [Kozakia baliensis]|uniref:Uncharacterized protein n=2 Tax=Kozakia baliensis TaxID=153496 RepID=A0A1D8UYD1_9PROT|nr:hypothetical protein [Kozakia baliensis]AOX18622.1 hypothetical protein A0U89_15025 [Kozakia baliensis]